MATTSPSEPDAELHVHVQPRAARCEIAGWREGKLLVRVAAPPVGGAANGAVQQLLAKAFGIAPSRVVLVAGETARDKRWRLLGLTPAEVAAKIETIRRTLAARSR